MFDRLMVEELVADVMSTMLQLDLHPTSATQQPANTELYLAHIAIEGHWQSDCYVFCPSQLAKRIAASMFQSEPNQLEPNEITDAMGELANILGGNLKGVLPGENHLSLPTVQTIGSDDLLDAKPDESDVSFECYQLPLTVRFRHPVECSPCPQ